MVEHDLAKVGVAGSSPVSRSNTTMRRTTSLLLLAATLVALPAAAQSAPRRKPPPPVRYGAALVPGDKAPTVSGYGLDGKEVQVSYAAAKLTVVNFWATWCVPCRGEMPALEKIRAAHPEPGSLQVVGALLNDPATVEEVKAVIDETGVTYGILAVPEGTGNAWGGLTLVPTTFLVDGEGKLVRKFVGTDENAVQAMAKDVGDFLAGRPLGKPYRPPSTK